MPLGTSSDIVRGLAAVLELAYRADSNSAAREGLWVRVPPAVPPTSSSLQCRATPPNTDRCIDALALTEAYPYLLGIYLGDGMLSRAPRNVWRLRVSLDTKYPAIVARVKAAISDVAARVAGEIGRTGCVELYSDWKHWICLFPQHGSGPKHLRSIELESWQKQAILEHPGQFLAGLIHSDGCRCLNRVKGHVYRHLRPRRCGVPSRRCPQRVSRSTRQRRHPRSSSRTEAIGDC
jgi:hypothetical protein